ncbi:MAG: hypothetical protein AB7P02_13860 [Alphaproteobacteria bacterium]
MTAAPPASPRYWLNRVMFDLGDPANRAAFGAGKEAFLARYPLGPADRAALAGPDWQALLARGALPVLVFKYFMLHGLAPERFAEIVGGGRHG